MHAFEYHRPSNVRQAAALLQKNEDAKIVAGGHTLLPTMKQRLAAPSALVDLGAMGELRGIEKKGRAVVIGAMTTHAEVATSDVVAEVIPGLAKLAEGIGDPAVRHRGTIGGSIANNDPAADYPAACIGLGATIITNKRKIAAERLLLPACSTLRWRKARSSPRSPFRSPPRRPMPSSANPASRYALAGVFVSKRGSDIRVAVTGAGSDGVFRWSEAEEALAKRFAPKSLDGMSASASDMKYGYSCRCGIPRASRRRDGAPRGCGCDRALSASNDSEPRIGRPPGPGRCLMQME